MSVSVSASMDGELLVLTVHGIEQGALVPLAAELEKHGVSLRFVDIQGQGAGSGDCVSGKFLFRYDGDRLKITLLENRNHFPAAMLVGGLRQLVEEAMEQVKAATA